MIDYGSLLFGPIYGTLGVEAVLTLADTAETQVTVTLIDKTGGLPVGPNVEIGTVVPGATVQVADLAAVGVTVEQLDDAHVSFSGRTWRIASHHPKPVPSGEADGEQVLILEADNG
ncbi:hypothetical protein LAC81_07670 [Ensifer adhaerens]|uniref:hypothetical protein n=1 Tax=Ensifer adhaerens TaxID=106592 RepID=UPI001CBAC572|nr:hypothetical protein [Ensifer adhaerens]MBZ7921658.1 hypothetical protein [Ensifer adhaerens]UAX94073.1 hypothetical protein LAC78_07665 [Ensifer adhaerens]UAY01707.1 hypothetical protein LAC80_07670 [Ensifer adhaerens]UAY09091.1 hypothetical protein LAC81_07670 [Ensifer adhaerens]